MVRNAVLILLLGAWTSLPFLARAQGTANVYIQHNLISDVPGLADATDPNLVDPWGMSFSATSPVWISNHGKGNTTLYSAASSKIAIVPLVVTIPSGAGGPTPSTPTGQVQNNTAGFLLANGNKASFIFSTEDGTISGWNGGTASIVMTDNSAAGAVYKGLAIATASSGPVLYAANFNSGKIDVFDTNFKSTTLAGSFTDPNLPSGFAPFNIWNLNGSLYVTYAKQDAAKKNDVAGDGNGAVDIFDLNGNMLQRLTANGPLNSPWGVAIAPANWGAFGGAVLVGNFGSGQINAFDPKTGNLLGTLKDANGVTIAIQGLWALLFGNGASGGDKNYLYFSAAITNGDTTVHGLYGSLAPPSQITGVLNGGSSVAGSIAPGEVISLTGITIGPRPGASSPALSSASLVNTTLGGTTVTINGTPAPILYTHADQANVIVPWGISGTSANIVVQSGSVTTAAFSATVAATAPGLFTTGATGSGQALALNQDGTINNSGNPEAAGSVIALYATGLGQTNPPGVDGGQNTTVIREAVATVSVAIGGKTAQVVYAGSAPDLIEGVMLVEAVVPAGAGTGAVTVVVTAGAGASSQAGTTISLK